MAEDRRRTASWACAASYRPSGGEFSLTGIDEVNVEVAALNFVLDETGDRMAIPNGEISTRTGRMRFEGVADLAERGRVTLLTRVVGGALPTPIGDARLVQLDRRRRASRGSTSPSAASRSSSSA